MNQYFLNLIILVALFSCSENSFTEPQSCEPLFINSIVSTDIDFITLEDSSTFLTLRYIGQEEKEMPDRRNDILMDVNAFVFEADFSDGIKVEIWLHSSFDDSANADRYAQMLTGPLGKLPGVMRNKLHHVVIHKGNETAFGESEGHFFVLYSENMETRLQNHDLEETVFHESVHATLEYIYKNNAAWQKAQTTDFGYITEYAEKNPKIEDLPETALFAYTMLKHPGRISPEIEEWINKKIPNRIEFFRKVFAKDLKID